MATNTSRIIYYSTKAKKPTLLYPKQVTWFNVIDDIYFKWKYNGTDTQSGFYIEVSKNIGFNDAVTYSATTSATEIYISSMDSVHAYIKASGIFYWRIKVTGTDKIETSDWSNYGTVNLDLEPPIVKGIDIVVPVGINGATYAAEIHSNLDIGTIEDGKLGFFVGEALPRISRTVCSNSGDKTRTLFGKISLDDLGASDLAAGHPVIEITTTLPSYYWTVVGKLISFAVVLGKNEKFTITFPNYGKTSYEFHISDSNLYPAGVFTSFPSQSSDEYSSLKMKDFIFIGGAETPPFVYSARKFILLSAQRPVIPFGKSPYNSSLPADLSEFDSTIKNRNGKNSFVTSIDLSNIKQGDAIWFQRSYDAFRSEPQSKDKIFKSEILGKNLTREWFVINSINRTTGVITLDSNFDNANANVQYPDSSTTIDPLPSISTSGAYVVETISVNFPSGETKTRKETTISSPLAKFKTGIYDRGTINIVGENGLSLRWLSMKHGTKYKFYPIINSSEQFVRVIGDIPSDFSDITGTISYFVAGDLFIPATSVLVEETSNAYVYLGAKDQVSGLKEYAIYKKNHSIKKSSDSNDIDYFYLDRIIPETGITWNPYINGFIELKLPKQEPDTVLEIFMAAKDNAENISHSTYSSMPSQMLRSSSFSEAISDNSEPSGSIWIDGGNKHATGTEAIVDIFPTQDNYRTSSMRLRTSPLNPLSGWSRWLQEPQGIFYSWHRQKLGTTYNFTVSVLDITDVSDSFFKIRITKDILNLKYEIIGSIIQFIDEPSIPKHSIIDIWKSGNTYDTLVLSGVPGQYVKPGANVSVETNSSAPDGSFSTGGLFSVYFKNTTDINTVNTLANVAGFKIDKDVNFVDNNFSTELKLGENFGARWTGWFYTNFESLYEIIMTGSSGRVKVLSEDKNGLKTLISLSDIGTSLQTGELSSGKIPLIKGWNRIIIEFTSKNKDAKISFSLRSDINDNIYQTISSNLTIWTKIPTIDAIADNTITTQSLYKPNELKGKTALINLLNAKTGSSLSSPQDAVNKFNDVNTTNNNTQININGFSDSPSFVFDDSKNYFVQVTGDYNIYSLVSSQFEESDNPYGYLIVKGDQTKNITQYGNSSYLLSQYILKITSNTSNSITFEPAVTGTWSSVSVLTNNIMLTDDSKVWSNNSLQGLVIVIDETLKYNIVSNSQNTITIISSDTNINLFKNKDYRIGDISDIASIGTYFYAPVGYSKGIVQEDDMVRNAAKIYAEVLDFWGKRGSFMNAISLRGISLAGPQNIEGSIIVYDINSERINEVITVGGIVYDANETENIIAVYESVPLSAPSGFLFWKTLSWQEDIPTDTSVEFYVKTALTESGLKTATYNIDAVGISHPPYTRADYDTPTVDPNSINIGNYSTDGTQDRFGSVKRNRWLQFKTVLKSSVKNGTPKVSDIQIGYTTNEERVFRSKNFQLQSNILRGFLSVNEEIPNGTNITWGISTSDSKDFNQYQTIPTEESFEVLEPNRQFRLSAKLSSSNNEIPKINSFAFIYETENSLELPNESL